MKVEVEIMLIQLGKNVALLWILRILAVPVVLVLFAAGFILNLLYGVVGAIGGLVSLLGGAAAVLALLDGCYGEAAASAAIAFLISPIALRPRCTLTFIDCEESNEKIYADFDLYGCCPMRMLCAAADNP